LRIPIIVLQVGDASVLAMLRALKRHE
jgi:hypothetical protein